MARVVIPGFRKIEALEALTTKTDTNTIVTE